MSQNCAEQTITVVSEKTEEGHLGWQFKQYYTQPRRKGIFYTQ